METTCRTTGVIAGSYMLPGDRMPYWSYYDDSFRPVVLAAEEARARVLARNDRLSDFLSPAGELERVRPASLFPPALAAGIPQAQLIPALMTGGRTFVPTEEGCELLGWSTGVRLDLARAGWGEGCLELRPEVKGAGTLFPRTRLSPARLRSLIGSDPEQRQCFDAACEGDPPLPALMISAGDFLKRPIGGQSERLARQAVDTSAVQLGLSRIKFLPAWLVVAQSDRVERNMRFFSGALPEREPRFNGTPVCELRFTPSTVRAIYFDRLEAPEDLRMLSGRVSRDPAELEQTLEEMIRDVPRYLEVIARTTRPADGGAFTWVKICDINEKFSPREAADHRRRRHAWFLAKDEVMVRRVGKFYTDMEGYFGKDVGYRSRNWEAMLLHHELFALTVLRDHLRVCFQFAVGLRARQGHVPARALQRRDLAAEIRTRIETAVNASGLLELQMAEEQAILRIRYLELGDCKQTYVIPREQLAERE